MGESTTALSPHPARIPIVTATSWLDPSRSVMLMLQVVVIVVALTIEPTVHDVESQQSHVAFASTQSVMMLSNPHGADMTTLSGHTGAPYPEQLARAITVPALAESAARLIRLAVRDPSRQGVVPTMSPQNGQHALCSFTCRPHPVHKKSFTREV